MGRSQQWKLGYLYVRSFYFYGIQSTNNGESHNPAIYNDRIVWYDYRNGNHDVYMFTLVPDVELIPLDKTNDLKDYVENSLSCNVWTKKALIKPLDKSIYFLEKEKDSKAVVSLNSFIYIERFIYFYCHVCVLKIKRYIIICY